MSHVPLTSAAMRKVMPYLRAGGGWRSSVLRVLAVIIMVKGGRQRLKAEAGGGGGPQEETGRGRWCTLVRYAQAESVLGVEHDHQQ